ncbi:hypothetical protein CRG98_034942 [Punica granatum]|uniref:Uncharacterized protein n=1 Tax=Punica granatum TaxID=22663 RepID=A0A2I0IKR6_PUNGR|nr:hypothetical protein CRG98_034942 [Punica granatum]
MPKSPVDCLMMRALPSTASPRTMTSGPMFFCEVSYKGGRAEFDIYNALSDHDRCPGQKSPWTVFSDGIVGYPFPSIFISFIYTNSGAAQCRTSWARPVLAVLGRTGLLGFGLGRTGLLGLTGLSWAGEPLGRTELDWVGELLDRVPGRVWQTRLDEERLDGRKADPSCSSRFSTLAKEARALRRFLDTTKKKKGRAGGQSSGLMQVVRGKRSSSGGPVRGRPWALACWAGSSIYRGQKKPLPGGRVEIWPQSKAFTTLICGFGRRLYKWSSATP